MYRPGGVTVGKMYRIGEMAKLARVSKRTIDYYTQLGLLVAERSDSNYRYYSQESLERLKLIEIFKREKLSLEEIKQRLDALNVADVSAADVSQKIHDIQEQMKKLENDVLQLKPLLGKLNEQQLKILTKQISIQGASLYQTLSFLFGEIPFI